MRIAVLRGNDKFKTTVKALDLIKGDIVKAIDRKGVKEILIKPNLLRRGKAPGANTDVNVVRGVITFLNGLGEFEITVGEGCSPVFGNMQERFGPGGYEALQREFQNVRLQDLCADPTGMTLDVKTLKGKGKVRIAKKAIEADYVVSVGKMKTHNHVVITLSLKNMMGCIIGRDRDLMHGGLNPGLVEMSNETFRKEALLLNYNLVRLSEVLYPDLSVIDGFIAMEGNGPGGGDPVDMNVVIAGCDALSVDLVAANLMGQEVEDVGYLRYLEEKRKPSVQVVGDDLSVIKRKFKVHDLYDLMLINYDKLKEMLEE